VTAPIRFPRFFVTSPAPCPYLPGRTERKVFTELKGTDADELNEALGRIGFRRSQSVAYRPSCLDCSACVSVRILAQEFTPSASQKRVIKNNADVVVSECRPWATGEQFDLLQHYLAVRHPGGGMAGMEESDYADMVEHTPVTSCIVEYREVSDNDRPGRLIGACLTDVQTDGLSMIYSFYDPDHAERTGLGNFIILDHIRRAAAMGLPYVYLGYWVNGSDRMQYKIRYRPMEKLTREGWRRLSNEEQDRLISAATRLRPDRARDEAPRPSKDGLAITLGEKV
jgi:arginine-tRNA-protein transferase